MSQVCERACEKTKQNLRRVMAGHCSFASDCSRNVWDSLPHADRGRICTELSEDLFPSQVKSKGLHEAPRLPLLCGHKDTSPHRPQVSKGEDIISGLHISSLLFLWLFIRSGMFGEVLRLGPPDSRMRLLVTFAAWSGWILLKCGPQFHVSEACSLYGGGNLQVMETSPR